MADSGTGRILAMAALAAGLFATLPALAQTNDPNLSESDLECLRRQAAGGPACVPGAAPEDSQYKVQGSQAGKDPAGADQPAGETRGDDAPPADASGAAAPHSDAGRPGASADTAAPVTGPNEKGADGAVALPSLIVDLFPNPPPAPAPDPEPAGPAKAAAADATPTADPPAAQTAPAGSLVAAPPVVAPIAVQGAYVPDEVLVTVDGDAANVAEVAAAFGLEVRSQRSSVLLGSTLARFGIPDGRPVGVVLAQLAGDARATRRVPNHVYDLQQAGSVVNYAFQRIALTPDGASGEGVRVAVIDTAIDETHPAIRDAIAGQFDALPGVEVTTRDHGTSVAGLIAGTGVYRGMAPGARIFHARAFEQGKSTMDVILAALDWAAGEDVRIVNMSFVGPRNDLLREACEAARDRGIVLVAAAGNNGPNAPYGYPAAYEGVIAVTATDDRDALMPQANRGPYVFVSAPGVNVVAPVGGGTDLVTGTSFAAAVVSGAIANLIHAAPDRTADSIEQALSATAKDLGAAGRDADFGFGLIDATAAAAVRE